MKRVILSQLFSKDGEVPYTVITINGIKVKIISDWDDFARTKAEKFTIKLNSASDEYLLECYPECFV